MAAEDWRLYKAQPAFVLGFHGCDASVANAVIAGATKHLETSKNLHDWLGDGIYFWEGSPHRAMEWAEKMAANPPKHARKPITTPAVVGAIIDLGTCCNLFDSAALDELTTAWEMLDGVGALPDGSPIPQNGGKAPDKLMRYRDRAVVEYMHALRELIRDMEIEVAATPEAAAAARDLFRPYDTVRAAFPEGGYLYEGSGFTRRSHIQIAVRNVRCIRGYFRPIVG